MFLKRISNKDSTKIVFENEEEYIEFTRSIMDAFPATNEFVKKCAERWTASIDDGYQASDQIENGHPSAIIKNSEIVDMIPMICSLTSDTRQSAFDRTKFVPSEKYNELMTKYASLEEALRNTGKASDRQRKEIEIQNLKSEKERLLAENESVNRRYMTALGSISATLIKAASLDVLKLDGYNDVLSGDSSTFGSVAYKEATKRLEKSISSAVSDLAEKETQSRLARIGAEKRVEEVERTNKDLQRISYFLIAKQTKFASEVKNVEPLLTSIKKSANDLYSIFLMQGEIPAQIDVPAENTETLPEKERETDNAEDDQDDVLEYESFDNSELPF